MNKKLNKEPLYKVGDHVFMVETGEDGGKWEFIVSKVYLNYLTWVYDLKMDESDEFPVMVEVPETRLFNH